MILEKIDNKLNKKRFLKRFQNKVVMVSGASSGIGKALALELLKRGFRVSLCARRKEVIDSYINELYSKKEIENRIFVQKVDVTQEAECESWVKKTYEYFGRIDILINNAGISMRALFDTCKIDVLRRLFDVNFWGTTYCSYYVLPYLLEHKGSLVGISSIAGYQPLPGRTAYSASKAAMQTLMKNIRIENKKKGLHVLVACPGFTASNIRYTALDKNGLAQGETPRNEDSMMTAEEVAKIIIWGIYRRRRSIILTPLGKCTVLLSRLFPKFVDNLTYSHMAKEPNSPFK